MRRVATFSSGSLVSLGNKTNHRRCREPGVRPSYIAYDIAHMT